MEKLAKIEEKLNLTIGILELMRAYCEVNADQTDKIPTLIPALDLVLETQKTLMDDIESLVKID